MIIFGMGHRFLKDDNEVRKEVGKTLDYFKNNWGEVTCISNLACGADTIFVQEAIKRNCKIEIHLPFQIEEYEKDFDADALILFREIISKYPFTIQNTITSTHEKDQAFFDAGRVLIQKCDVTLAVWDGAEGRGQGGTKDLLDYCANEGKIIHWIKASRKDDKDISALKKDNLIQDFNTHDKLAIQHKSSYRKAWKLGILFGLSTIFAIESNFNYAVSVHSHLLITLFGLISLYLSYVLLTKKANNHKRIFSGHRKNAENLRAQIWQQNTGEHYSSLTKFYSTDKIDAMFFESKKRELWLYVNDQILYQKNRRIQVFSKNILRMDTYLSWLRYVFFSSLILLAVSYTVSYLIKNQGPYLFLITEILGFLWMSIPPLYASLEGVIHFNEWKKNKNISLELLSLYLELQSQIFTARNQAELAVAENRLFESFTFEVNQWYKEEQNKNLELKI